MRTTPLKFASFATSLALLWLSAASMANGEGALKALLIGVSEYSDDNIADLPYVQEDLSSMEKALVKYGGYTSVMECGRTHGRRDNTESPTAAKIKSKVKEFLRNAGDNDQLLLYFSGHGELDDDGNLLLIPADCNTDTVAGTSLSATWLRQQLAAKKAASKCLIFDTCYAGAGGASVDTRALHESFHELDSVVVLASSQRDVESDDYNGHSLFTYWLAIGLRGAADFNSDGIVDFGEAYRYVHDRVVATCRHESIADQIPVQFVGTTVLGYPVLSKLKPRPTEEVLRNMAFELATAVQSEDLKPFAYVPEFFDVSYDGGRLEHYVDTSMGRMGQSLSAQLADYVAQESGGELSVDPISGFDGWSSQKKEKMVVAHGIAYQRGSNVYQLRVKVNEVRTGRSVVEVGGLVSLNREELAMTNSSSSMNFASKSLSVGEEEEVVRRAARSAGTNPHQNDNLFDLSIAVTRNAQGRPCSIERPIVRIGAKSYVELNRGEQYKVRLHSNHDERVYAQLLIDNIPVVRPLSSATQSYRVAIQTPDVQQDNLIKHCVFLFPDATVGIPGYLSHFAKSSNGTWTVDVDAFEVVEAKRALGSRLKTSNDIGLITLFIRREGKRGLAGPVGTAPSGNVVKKAVKMEAGGPVSDLIFRRHVEYLEHDALESKKRQATE